MWQTESSPLGKFQIKTWDFPESDLEETPFHAFYLFASLLL